MIWTEAQKAFVKEKWEAGVSARTIAAELHTSRNAICGIVNRNHWQTPNTPLNRPHREKRAVHRVLSQTGERLPRRAPAIRRTHSPTPQPPLERDPEPAAEDMAIPIEQRCTLMELGRNNCRWPVGDSRSPDLFFCGAVPMETGPYCRAHYLRATQPARLFAQSVVPFYRQTPNL
jgi:GcrA cell cycle regulator